VRGACGVCGGSRHVYIHRMCTVGVTADGRQICESRGRKHDQ
jgi:hypothetical protein